MTSLHSFRAAAAWLLAGFVAAPAMAHGLIQDPPSRNWFCGFVTKPHEIGTAAAKYPECGGAFSSISNTTGGYQFMSVLTHARGRAAVTPLPTHVCGFNSETFNNGATPWDAAINWPTTPIAAGLKVFTWNISWGPHFDDSEEFRYWITKPDFKFMVGKPLTWSDFEDAPFCVETYKDTAPTANPDVTTDKAATLFKTTCNVPARTGRQVIYGEWGRNQYTLERFHSCMDVVFQGGDAGGGGGSGAPVAVKGNIVTQPYVGAHVTGAATVLLDGRGSSGTNLTYRWSVSAPNNSLYTLETPNAATTSLRMSSPPADQNVQVALMVSSGTATDNTSLSFTHKPAAVTSIWRDLGALTPSTRVLKAGDTVQLRVVSSTGADTFLPPSPLTITAANAAATAWPVALANAVNSVAGSTVRLGVLGAGDQVTPVASGTANRIHASKASNVGSGCLMVTSAPLGAGGGVSASYTVFNDWKTGYCANVAVKNNGTTTVTWASTLKVEGTVRNFWNGANWKQTGNTVSFAGPSWGATLAPGASYLSAGFCALR